MPWYPKAVRKQLTYPNRARNKILMSKPVRIGHHTAVSNSGSLFNFFNSSGARGVFSHFYITKTGGVEQYQNTDYRASADLDGNPDTISIETWDGYRSGYPGYWLHDSDVPPWNDAQMAALIELDRWILANHPSIPRRLATDNRRGPSSHGLSWHRLGVVGASGYIPTTQGGLRYSLAEGKICPGPRRISQIPDIYDALVPKLPPTGVNNGPATQKGILDMTGFISHTYSKPQTVRRDQNDKYLSMNDQGWWLIHGKPGLFSMNIHGYADLKGNNVTGFIRADRDSDKTHRVVGRVAFDPGTNSFSGSAVGKLAEGEVLRVMLSNHSGNDVVIHNITTNLLTED